MSVTVTPASHVVTPPATKGAPVAPTPEAPPAVEAAAAAAAATPAEEPKVSPKLALLARQQQALREQQRKLAEERAALEKERAAYVRLEDIQKNPLDILTKANVTYDQLTQQAMVAVDPVESKFQALERKLAAFEEQGKLQAEQAKKAEAEGFEKAKKQIVFEAAKIAEDPAYEAVKFFGEEAMQRVADVIFERYNETQQLLSVEDAVKMVEDEYTEELKKLASLGKLKSLILPATEAKEEPANLPKTSAKTIPTTTTRTLTNTMTQATTGKLTLAQRRERAIRMAQGLAVD